MIISTDMSLHFDLMERIQRRMEACPDVWQWEDTNLLLQLVLHMADIVNPCRPFFLAKEWAELVVSEFLQQVVPSSELRSAFIFFGFACLKFDSNSNFRI